MDRNRGGRGGDVIVLALKRLGLNLPTLLEVGVNLFLKQRSIYTVACPKFCVFTNGWKGRISRERHSLANVGFQMSC